MKIKITSSNLDKIAHRVANCVNQLGFSKNQKPMVNSQALKVVAAVAGFRQEHALVAALKSQDSEDTNEAEHLLGSLVGYLLRSYPDDMWDEATRDMLEEANQHLGYPAIEWMLDEDDEDDENPLQGIQDLDIPLLVSLGYSVQESDFHRPYWEKDGEASEDYDSDIHAWKGAYQHAVKSGVLRRYHADACFEDYDFGQERRVVGDGGWEQCGDIWTKAVFLEHNSQPLEDSHKVYLQVVFAKDSARVLTIMLK